MAIDKEWTTSCILAGVEIGRLLREHKLQTATTYLVKLTSELTTLDINYLVSKAYAMVTKEV